MDQGTLNYIETGQGKPVVLLHGMAASLRDWDWLAPSLDQAGFRAIRVDLLGHGDSSHPDNPADFDLKAIYLAFENWLESLDLQEPAHLVGHSLGGYLALRYALRYPDRVQSLALISPLYCMAQLNTAMRVFRRRPGIGIHAIRLSPVWLIDRALAWDPSNADRIPAETRRQIAADYKRASPHFLNITRRIPDLSPELPRLHRPVLLMWGERDRTLDPESFPRMASRLPDVEVHRMLESGHQPHIGKALELNQFLIEWLLNHG